MTDGEKSDELIPLSDRELGVLRLLVQGMNNRQIAQQLRLRVETVKVSMKHILEKLSVLRATQGAIEALRSNCVDTHASAKHNESDAVISGGMEVVGSRLSALTAVDFVPCGVVLVDADGKIELVNAKAETLFGYNQGELVRKSVEELVPEQLRARHSYLRCNYMNRPEGRPIHAGRNLRGRRKDGSEFGSDIGLTPLETVGGTNVLATIIDVAERERSEEVVRLNLLMKQRDEFAAALAHDLKSPLFGCSRMLDFLLQGRLGPLTAGQSRSLQTLKDTSGLLLQRVQNLVDVHRIEQGSFEQHRECIDVEGLLLGCCQEIAPLANSRNICIETQVMANLGLVDTDTSALHRVLQNLLDNAQKFSPTGSSIEISARIVDGRLEIEVSDRGPGIPAAQQEHLFQRFWQGAPGLQHQTGSGLGLSICKLLLKNLGGDISYRDREGGGSIFSVVLSMEHNDQV